jgi:lysophospholipase L1-like esterase
MYIKPENERGQDKIILAVTCVMAAVLAVIVISVAAAYRAKEPAAPASSTTVAESTAETTGTPETPEPAETETTAAPVAEATDAYVPFDTTPESSAESDTGAAATDTNAPAESGSSADYDSVILGETEDMGQEYIDKIVFLGDSTTYGLRAYSMLSGGKDTTQVWTPMSGTLTLSYANVVKIVYPETNEEITIAEAVERKKPEYLVITLGVNGVSFMDEASFKKEYSKLIENIKSISPNTKIMLQSIFPVADNYALLDSINNNKIDAANKWVKAIAKECGVKYLDTQSVLRGDDGNLIKSYQNGDGIHLETSGFQAVLTYIRYHGYTD